MRVLVATWYDAFNQSFLTEYYKPIFNIKEILDFYADQKLIYGRQIIADYADTRVFSDGTRVIIQDCQIKSELGGYDYNPEETIDVGLKRISA